jgi:hypothetical protein
MAPPIAPTPTADKATATATPVINCLTVLRMFVSHPSGRDRRSRGRRRL